MSDLITTIEAAYQSPDNEALTNKAHRLLLSHTFFLPIQKNKDEPTVLFLNEEGRQFIPFFSNEELFKQWAGELINDMDCLNILGKDVILGSSDAAYLCLDIGQAHYKEFAPSEIRKLKQVVIKLERIVKSGST